jgi:hypothetical protein
MRDERGRMENEGKGTRAQESIAPRIFSSSYEPHWREHYLGPKGYLKARHMHCNSLVLVSNIHFQWQAICILT